MARLSQVRVAVVVVGLLALVPVLLSNCGPGGPRPPTAPGALLVGDAPDCYSDEDISNGTVPVPKPSDERQYIYARFEVLPTAKERSDFERATGRRIRFMDSLGNRAFAVRINTPFWGDGLKRLRAEFRVACLANYKRSNRATRVLLDSKWRERLRGYDDIDILSTVYVRFYGDVPLAEQKAILSSVGALNVDDLETFNDEWRVTLPDAEIENLADNGQVQWLEQLDPQPEDDIDEARLAIGLPADFANEGDGTVIAQWEICHPANKVPDEHPDLVNRAATGLGAKVCTPVSSGVSGTSSYVPSNRHATRVAGILAGDGSASAGDGGTANQWRGMVPKAKVVSYSVHDNDSYGLIKEYVDAASSMAVISSNSWGSLINDYYHRDLTTTYAFRSALFDAVSSGRSSAGSATGPGRRLLVVASSGNRGGDRVDPTDPSSKRVYWRTARMRNSAKNVLTVGNVASGEGTSVGKPAFDTGRGPTADGRIKPDLVAPGSQDLLAIGPKPGITAPIYPAAANAASEYYAPGWGTSFSTPIVAGAAAMLSTTIRNGTCARNPTPAELRALLIHTARDLVDASSEAGYTPLKGYSVGEYAVAKEESYFFDTAAPNFGPDAPYTLDAPPAGVDALVGPDYVFGYGMVQPARADTLASAGNFLRASVNKGYVEYPIFVSMADLDDGMLRVTLAWDDPPSSRNVKPDPETGYLQNDLDLVVVAPNGRRYFPWVLDPGNPAQPAKQESRSFFEFWPKDTGDHRNTIEQVLIKPDPSMLDRTWRIQVWGTTMVLPPQEFALASEIIKPSVPCAGIAVNVEEKPAMPPRDRLFWVLFIIAVVMLLLLLLWLVDLVYNAYLHEGKRQAALRVLLILLILYLIAWALFRYSDCLMDLL